MRMTLICAAAILGSTAATAQQALQPSHVSQLSTAQKTAAQPVATPNVVPSGSFLGGGTDCANPVIIPAGPTGAMNFGFDNTAAVGTGITNPFAPLCQHNGQTGIDNEEWFSWTATADGTARINSCSNLVGVDTKIAIYADDCAGITANTADPISCKDDDYNCPTFEATVVWDITMGTTYLIQFGTFVGATGGVGDFSIEELPARANGQYDMGASQNAFGTGALDGTIMWMHVLDAGLGELVTSLDVAFGTPGGAVDPDGDAVTVVVYDGDPINGLTFLGTDTGVTANSATDTFVNFPFTTPVAVTGIYTVAVMVTNTAGSFPAAIDHTVNSRGRTWLAWDNTGAAPIDIMDPVGTATAGPAEMQFGFVQPNNLDGVWLLRSNTIPNAANYPEFCFGDGGNQMGCTNCPCTNDAPIGSGGGCLNSAGTGARLIPSGNPSVSLPSGDTTDLRFGIDGAPPTGFCILNSGDALAPGNMANPCFGLGTGAQAAAFDGLRCAITNTRRHGGRSADANGEVGVTNNPWGGEGGPPVGLAVAGGGFASGQTRFFQVINRDDPMAVCMRALNTSQAVEVTFTP